MQSASWKSKIDPCFEEVVKFYVSLIREHKELLGNGHFGVKDEFSEYLNGLDQHGFYLNSERQKGNVFEFLDFIGITKLAVFNDLEGNIRQRPEESFNSLISLIEAFPEESKDFYIKKFNSLRDGSFVLPVDGLLEEDKKKVIKRNTDELSALLCSLLCRYLFLGLEEALKEESTEDEDFFKNPTVLGLFLSSFYTLLAQIAHQRTIPELLAKGDDSSLLKAIAIDKSLLYSDAVKDRFMKAHISGNAGFLEKVGKAISIKPINKEAQHYETYLVLKLFWKAGLSKLKREDLYYFLKSCDLVPPNYPYGFERFLHTYIIPLYKD